MRYPYFVSDAMMVLLTAALIILSALFPTLLNITLALLAICVLAAVYTFSQRKVSEFEKGMKFVEGLRSWSPEFLSLGTIILDYKGTEARYWSTIGMSTGERIPVEYHLSFQNGNSLEFRFEDGSKGIPRRMFPEKVLNEIQSFEGAYPIKLLRNTSGILEIVVSLEFSKAKTGNDLGKIKSMADFVSDTLYFGSYLNGYLFSKSKRMKNKQS